MSEFTYDHYRHELGLSRSEAMARVGRDAAWEAERAHRAQEEHNRRLACEAVQFAVSVIGLPGVLCELARDLDPR